jgi:hypothetical protein
LAQARKIKAPLLAKFIVAELGNDMPTLIDRAMRCTRSAHGKKEPWAIARATAWAT